MIAHRILHTSVLFLVLAVTGTDTVVQAQPISGKFYLFEIVGAPGIEGMTGIPFIGPSINDNGKVAFVGTISGSRALFVSDPGSATPRFIVAKNVGSLSGGFGFNNTEHVLARELFASNQRILYDFPAALPGPYTPSLVAQSGAAFGNDFNSLNDSTALSNNDHIAFSGVTLPPSAAVLATGRRSTGFSTATLTPAPALAVQPMVADDGRVVVQAGGAVDSPIRLYNYDLATFLDIATSANFSVLGRSPGVSANGCIVVFYGNHTAMEEGIFASLQTATDPTANRQLVKLVGRQVENETINNNGNDDGVCDSGEACWPGELGFEIGGTPRFFATNGFSTNSRVGIVHHEASPDGLAGDSFVVAFIATPNAGSSPQHFSAERGLWTINVELKSVAGSIVEKPSTAIPVIQLNDRLGTRTITDIQVYDPIAGARTDHKGLSREHQRRWDHRVTFMATTDVDGPVVVRATQLDTDEDSLFDHWETSGVDFNNDGTVDLALHQSPFFAKPSQKDVFVEVDWLRALGNHTHFPQTRIVADLRKAFAASPSGRINLHMMLDEPIDETIPCCSSTVDLAVRPTTLTTSSWASR